MYAYRIFYRILAGAAVVVLAALMVGCGNSSSATGGSTASATPTAANCPTSDTGTVQSFSGSKLLISDLQGKQVQVTFSSSTRFSRETTVAPSALQTGERVSVRTKQNADSTYAATQITVSRAFAGTSSQTGQFTRGSGSGTPNAANRTCTFRGINSGSRRSTTGNGNGSTTGSSAGPTAGVALAGTISQVNKNAIIVTDVNGDDYTIGLTSTTQITSQSTASASDIQTGQAVTVLGTNSGGVIAARSVTILLHLPNRTQG